MAVRLEVLRPSALSSRARDEVTAFVSRFLTYQRSDVDACVDRSSYVLLFRDGQGAIVASTAVRERECAIDGRAVRVLLTSMVVVDPSQRRRGLLARMGAYSYARARLRWRGPLYWAAVAGTAEGYAQMANNFARFWPAEEAAIPPEIEALMLAIAEEFHSPIVRDELGRVLLFATLVPVEERRWSTGAAAYFRDAIARQPVGAGIVCVAPLSARAMARALLRQATRIVAGPGARPAPRAEQPRSSAAPDARRSERVELHAEPVGLAPRVVERSAP